MSTEATKPKRKTRNPEYLIVQQGMLHDSRDSSPSLQVCNSGAIEFTTSGQAEEWVLQHGIEPKGSTVAMLQVCRADGASVFDWRHLQDIKNLVCGDEWEACEIFPAESRLKDPSNARYLWASRSPLPFGLPGGRVVMDANEAFAPQRPFGDSQ